MPVEAAQLIKDDQDHLIHPLHHPSEHLEPMVYVRGRGAMITDIQGRDYIDGLAGLWNVNVGHGREELGKAAADQMGELAYYSCYTGSSNVPAIQLADKLIELAPKNMQAVFFTSGGAESNESAFKTARFYWKAKGKEGKFKVISRFNAYHGVTLQAMSATGMAPYWKMFEPRVPGFVHTGPKVTLINGQAGSGGDAFPYYFKKLGLGPLIGTRTWGGLIGLSGSPALVDGTNLSAPTFRFLDTEGNWGIENEGVAPDIEVIDRPDQVAKGQDPSLEKAIQVLLEELRKNPPAKVKIPKPPVQEWPPR